MSSYRLDRTVVSIAALAVGLTFAASPATAQQVQPGDPQCPIADDLVTCSGDVSQGFRSDRNAVIERILFRDLTAPIAPTNRRPAIDVRPRGDLTLDLDSSVTINSVDPSSSFPYSWNGQPTQPDAAVVLLFDPTRQTRATILNAGTVNVTGTNDYQNQNIGAFFISDADVVNFTNIGTIAATYTDDVRSLGSTVNTRLMSGARIVGADEIAFLNQGSIGNTGYQTIGVFLEGRAMQLINTGQIAATYDDPEREDASFAFGPRPTTAIAIATQDAPARLEWRNTGTIRSIDTTRTGRVSPRAHDNYLAFYGRGTIDLFNSGTLDAAGIILDAAAQTRTDDLTIAFTNAGPVSNAQLILGTGSLDQRVLAGRTSIWQERGAAPASVSYRAVDIQILNTGALTTSSLVANGSGDDVRVEVINRGVFDGPAPGLYDFANFLTDPVSMLAASGSAPLAGSAIVRLTNEGDMTLTGSAERAVGHHLLSASSSHQAELTNSGNLTLDAGTGRAYALTLGQGFRFESTLVNGRTESAYYYVFDGRATLRNSGQINLSGDSSEIGWIYGLHASSAADLAMTNSAAVTIANDLPEENYVTGGAWLQSLSDATFENNAPITITSNAAGEIRDGIGITLLETSLQADLATAVQSGNRARGYDRAADLASRITLNLNAGDITVTANGGIGVYGVLGATGSSERFIDDMSFRAFDTIENGNAEARINIAGGVSVIGGTGRSAGINFEGAGRVTLNNAGTIVSRGDATSGGVVLGNFIAAAHFGLPPTPAAGLTLNLVDSVNSGTIASIDGYGIWVQTGAITNFVNSGVVQGGVAAIRARDASSIVNEAGGVIDGAVVLEGAGSTLRNSGILRFTSGAAGTHRINGDYSQSDTGVLAFRLGDRMEVAGDFALAGDLNVALGAPSLTAIIDVGGDLSLDGRLNVTDAGGFGQGVYRLFAYGGSLTDRGLDVGVIPTGRSGAIQTAIAGQVNLIVSGIGPGPGPDPDPDPDTGPTPDIQFWDGSDTSADGVVDGGSGAWTGGGTNWTRANGDVNEAWGGRFSVFQGAPGTVTIDAGGVSATGLQFAVSGYTLTGGSLALSAPATLRVGDGSAGGASMTATIASIITGAAGIDKTDLGTLILTGANNYSGGTTISGGVLQVSDDTNLGAASGGVTLNGGSLRWSADASSARTFTAGTLGGTIDNAKTLDLSGAIGGSGTLTKTGAGRLSLTGGSSAFTGTFVLAGGDLRLEGVLGGTLKNQAGTRLTGTGTLANLTVGGTLAPGNSLGTLTATGNVTFAPGSTFEVEVGPDGASDRLMVTGSATLQGGNVSALFLGNPDLACGTTITSTILTAQGGITGTFSGVTANYAFLTPSLSYDANNVRLTLGRNPATFGERGATPNQRSSAAAAEALRCGNALFDAIVPLDADTARSAFEQISGAVHVSASAALLEDSRFFRDAMLAPREGRGIWGHAYGSWGHIESDGNAAGLDRDGAGAFAGIDLPLGGRMIAGLGGGYSQVDYTDGGGFSSAGVESWQIGGAFFAQSGRASFAAGGALAWHRFDVDRVIAFAGFADSPSARYDGETRQLFARAGVDLPLGRNAMIEPFAELAWVEIKASAFAESGGPAALSGDGHSTDVLFTSLGARGTARLGPIALRGRLGWRHAFDADPQGATFAFAGGDAFTIAGTPISQDALIAETGLELSLGRTRVDLNYSGQIGERSEGHGVRATLRLLF